MDVFLTEVSSVKDETDLTVSIVLCLLQHLLELRDIDDASGILLIVKRLGVVMVIGDRVIQDRLSVVILRMTDLDTLQIARLAVLVGRFIRDIDLFTVIMPVAPFILESNALISRDTVNKRRDLRITVELHPLRKQRVILGIIRIVLTGVVFRNDGIRCQIQEETGFLSDQPSDDLVQMILDNDLSDHDECSDPETGTPISDFPRFRKFCLREVFQKVGVGIHRLSRSIQALTCKV